MGSSEPKTWTIEIRIKSKKGRNNWVNVCDVRNKRNPKSTYNGDVLWEEGLE